MPGEDERFGADQKDIAASIWGVGKFRTATGNPPLTTPGGATQSGGFLERVIRAMPSMSGQRKEEKVPASIMGARRG